MGDNATNIASGVVGEGQIVQEHNCNVSWQWPDGARWWPGGTEWQPAETPPL